MGVFRQKIIFFPIAEGGAPGVVLSTPVLEQQSTEIDTSTNAVWFMVFNVTFNNISVISS